MDSEFWTAVGSTATAVALAFTAVQIALATRQERTQFEDSLVKEYRELLGSLPREALVQHPAADADECVATYLPQFYRYFDLCNEQVFLRQKGRIGDATWAEWRDGMLTNLQRPGYRAAWRKVQSSTSSFTDLRCLCANRELDPRSRRWGSALAMIQRELARRGEMSVAAVADDDSGVKVIPTPSRQ
ncbi:MAG TPA: hypothetical protein VE974_00230 [Thermoanaerobaculia bacterium]|nr:hypothetical protein [Thermoanaerobaculia bacterium]